MQGVWYKSQRINTKKALKAYAQEEPHNVRLEATSLFGNEYDGPLSNAPTNKSYTVVGPDPYKKRNWYANIKWNPNKEAWIVT